MPRLLARNATNEKAFHQFQQLNTVGRHLTLPAHFSLLKGVIMLKGVIKAAIRAHRDLIVLAL
jgi:hypothetical protein